MLTKSWVKSPSLRASAFCGRAPSFPLAGLPAGRGHLDAAPETAARRPRRFRRQPPPSDRAPRQPRGAPARGPRPGSERVPAESGSNRRRPPAARGRLSRLPAPARPARPESAPGGRSVFRRDAMKRGREKSGTWLRIRLRSRVSSAGSSVLHPGKELVDGAREHLVVVRYFPFADRHADRLLEPGELLFLSRVHQRDDLRPLADSGDAAGSLPADRRTRHGTARGPRDPRRAGRPVTVRRAGHPARDGKRRQAPAGGSTARARPTGPTGPGGQLGDAQPSR